MKRTLLVVVLLVLVCVPAAYAEQLAPDVAAKLPMQENVYCASDTADWQALVAHYGLPANANGLTVFSDWTIHLRPDVCVLLRAPFAISSALAYAALFHEFTHAALRTRVESQADCVSLFMYRYWLRRSFGASVSDAQTAYDVAWAAHTLRTPDYQGSCVQEHRDLVSPLNL